MKPSTITNCAPFSRYDNIELCTFQDKHVILKTVKNRGDFKHEKRMYDVLQEGGSVRGIARRIASYDQTLVVEYIAAKDLPTDLSMKLKVTELLLKTVQRMHEKGIAHKDLRFEDNVIFDGERFVIIDLDAACFKSETCSNRSGNFYASEIFFRAEIPAPEYLPWAHWVFLDYLYLVGELTKFFEGSDIGKRLDHLMTNAFNKARDLIPVYERDDLAARVLPVLLNANVIRDALKGETDLTADPNTQAPFPSPPALDGLNRDELLSIMRDYTLEITLDKGSDGTFGSIKLMLK